MGDLPRPALQPVLPSDGKGDHPRPRRDPREPGVLDSVSRHLWENSPFNHPRIVVGEDGMPATVQEATHG